MSWALELAPRAVKQLAKLDKATAKMIVGWLRKNVDGCENPRLRGKALSGNLRGSWRYRIGNYRVLCEILDDKLVVIAFEIEHRSAVYEKKTLGRKHKS